MSGKSPKKSIKLCRPKKTHTKHEIWKKSINQVGDDELANLLSDLVDNGDEELIKKIKEISKKTKLSSRKTATILNVSKSTICNLRRWKEKPINKRKSKKEKLTNMIYDILVERYFRVGREPIVQIMLAKYGFTFLDANCQNHAWKSFGLWNQSST